MKIAGKKPWYLEYLLIIVGTGLMGTAITSCFDAAGMVTGGFSGIAILVKAWTKGLYGNGIPLWITNLILNVPLFLLATKIKGFADSDAIMTGVETRSSSPVRIVRDDSLQSETVKGLYPCGEGPGYAGGIMSAGVDGIKCAIAVLEHE